MYCTTADVYRHAGITSSEVSEADVVQHILDAEVDVDKFTNTTYWSVEKSGTASAGGSDTLTNTGAGYTASAYVDDYLWIYDGTGSGQMKKITANTTDTFTVEEDWDTEPDNTSKFRVIHSGNDPVITETFDGDGTTSYFVEHYPIKELKSVTIDSTSVTASAVYVYGQDGELKLGRTAEVSVWKATQPQLNVITYWYGVYSGTSGIDRMASQLTAVYAALAILNEQMGGTHNIPSTYTLPEGSVTVGQAYINIEGTVRRLMDKKVALERDVRRYPAVA